MHISLNWLTDFVELNINKDKQEFNNVVVGFIEEVGDHPNADSLKVAKVNVGKEELQQIVCGGTNLTDQIYVAVALPGAVLPGDFTIQPVKLRGVESNGMICHLSELGLAEDEGKRISILEDLPKNIKPGTAFKQIWKQDGIGAQELANLLTLKSAEVEKVVTEGDNLEGIVVGELLEFEKIKDSDKLHSAKVDIGKKKPIQLIFGSMIEMKVGLKVPVAVAPMTLPTGIKIEKKKLKGIVTEGMFCLDQELGLSSEGVSIQYFPDLEPGTSIKEALKLNDILLEFDNKSLTHRPDLWGHYGIAREVAAITGSKFLPLEPKVEFPSKGESVKVEIKDYDLCPRYCGLIIENIKVGPSPNWLTEKLKATGHGIHNNIVDVTNYVMHELGQPMHAFDKDFIEGGIIVRRAEEKERITTLDDKERELTSNMLVIADHKKPVAVAGVMGGQNSEIKDETTAIILESANFSGSSIRQTSTKLGLRTDAVQRFEKSLAPALAELAIKRAAELILKICPEAQIAGALTDEGKFDTETPIIDLDTNKTRSKIGIEIKDEEIKDILESLHFTVEEKKKNLFSVGVPSFRASKDVKIEDDLIEEVARIYGYDNIPATFPKLPAKLPEANTERFKKHRLRELMSYGLGFSETYNYSFYGKNELNNCLMNEDAHLKVLNYLSEEQTHMRTTLIPNLIKTLQCNANNFEEIRVYEIGRTYKELGEFMPLEEKNLAGAIMSKGNDDKAFYQAKGVINSILKKFNLGKVKTAAGVEALPYAHPTKSVSYIDHNGQTIAKVFVLHPLVQKNHDLEKQEIAMFELNFNELVKLSSNIRKYRPIAKFPEITIDISVVVPRDLEVEKASKAIRSAHQNLITGAELFDIYQGDGISEDKKAVAYKVTLQAKDRTLTDEEMTDIQKKIFSNLEKIGGKIRGA
jgi:phenylalanyl-tRNA synthetase beta chain